MTRHSSLSCNKPRKSWKTGKKRVVRACSRGKSKTIHFGASGYGHNYNATARRSFRARHKCATAKDKLTARYWACKNLWTRGGSTQKCPRNRKCKGRSRRRRSKSRRKSRRRRSKSRKRRSKSRRKSRRRR